MQLSQISSSHINSDEYCTGQHCLEKVITLFLFKFILFILHVRACVLSVRAPEMEKLAILVLVFFFINLWLVVTALGLIKWSKSGVSCSQLLSFGLYLTQDNNV